MVIPRDLEKSFHFAKLAAKNQSLSACFHIGQTLLKGDERFESDVEEGLNYLELCGDSEEVDSYHHISQYRDSVKKILKSIDEDGM